MSPAIDRNPPWIANTGTCPVFDDDYRFQLRFANGNEFDVDEFDGDAEDYDWRLDLPPEERITHWRTWEPSKQATTPIASKQAPAGIYTVFSTSKTYATEAEAREAALKFAATGGVWHVARVIGSAVAQPPKWEGV